MNSVPSSGISFAKKLGTETHRSSVAEEHAYNQALLKNREDADSIENRLYALALMEKKKNFAASSVVVLSEGLVENENEEDSREDKGDESGVVKIQRSESEKKEKEENASNQGQA